MRLVLLHGFTQTGASWRPILEALPGGGELEVTTPHLPGHGGAAGVIEGMDLGRAAADLAAACGRATYAGYSMGGRLALQLALDHPDMVDRLVLVSTTAGIEDLDGRLEREQADHALADRIEEGGDEGLGRFFADWLSGPLFRGLDDEQADIPSRLENTASGLAAALRTLGTGAQLPTWERLGSLAMPVLVVAGGRDEKFAGLGRRLRQAIGPNATFVVVPGAGHAVPFEQPEPFAKMLSAFSTGKLDVPPAGG